MNFISIFTKYWFVFVIIFIFISFYIFDIFIIPKRRLKKIEEFLKRMSQENNLKFEKSQNSIYQFTLKNDQNVIFIKTVFVPQVSAITVNSRNTWSLTYGGSPNSVGKSYPNQRYMHELVKFLEFKPKNDNKTLKLVIVYPSTNKIQKYLNESEIAIIKNNEMVYDYKIVTFIDLESQFFSLIK